MADLERASSRLIATAHRRIRAVVPFSRIARYEMRRGTCFWPRCYLVSGNARPYFEDLEQDVRAFVVRSWHLLLPSTSASWSADRDSTATRWTANPGPARRGY
jgi:hypothetical protein